MLEITHQRHFDPQITLLSFILTVRCGCDCEALEHCGIGVLLVFVALGGAGHSSASVWLDTGRALGTECHTLVGTGHSSVQQMCNTPVTSWALSACWLSTPPATRALPANSRSPHNHCIKRSGETLPQTLSTLHLPQMPTSMIRKKKPSGRRGSGTTGLASEAEKIMSGVERQLIKLLDSDSDEDAAELARVWPNAPPSCVVVVPGVKGHFKYIMNIKDRLAGEGFVLGLPYPHRPKVAGQLSLQQEAAMRRRQAKEDTALTPEQKERIEFNRRRALEIRHAASAQSGGRAEDFC